MKNIIINCKDVFTKVKEGKKLSVEDRNKIVNFYVETINWTMIDLNN